MISIYHKIHGKLSHSFLEQGKYGVLTQEGDVRLNDQVKTKTDICMIEN